MTRFAISGPMTVSELAESFDLSESKMERLLAEYGINPTHRIGRSRTRIYDERPITVVRAVLERLRRTA